MIERPLVESSSAPTAPVGAVVPLLPIRKSTRPTIKPIDSIEQFASMADNDAGRGAPGAPKTTYTFLRRLNTTKSPWKVDLDEVRPDTCTHVYCVDVCMHVP